MVVLSALLVACGGGGGDGLPSTNTGNPGGGTGSSNCSAATAKTQIRDYMRSDYYWNNQIQSQLADNFLYNQAGSNLETYFNSLRWTPALRGKDRYSFMYTETEYNAAASAESTGFGVAWAWVSNGNTKVARALYVEPGSPGAIAGIVRGDTLLSVNGGAFTYGAVTQSQIDALYPAKVGTSTDFSIRPVLGSTKNLRLASVVVDESPVLLTKTITGADGRKVGYLVFNTFMAQKGLTQLQSAFRQFKKDGITDLVLDLRYNGGGLLDISRKLAGMIGGETLLRGKTFYRMIHNANLSSKNKSLTFDVDADPEANLGLARVFVLTASGTASASEALIYGLKPFISVVQIGETSYGKPVGMYTTEMCGNYYFAINFEGVNASNEGGYYSGIAPTCTVSDNLSSALGDENEAMLAGALGYRTTGACPVAKGATQSVAQHIEAVRDNPLRNNMLIQR